MSNYLPIPFSGHRDQGHWEKGRDCSGFFWLDRGVMESWVSMPALSQGAFMEGDESPWNDKTTCSNVVCELINWYPFNSIWRFFLLYFRRNKLNRSLKLHGPEIYRIRKLPRGLEEGLAGQIEADIGLWYWCFSRYEKMQELGRMTIFTWKHLTVWRSVLPVFFPEHRVPHSWFLPWTPFRECWRSVAIVTLNLIFVETNCKCQFPVIRAPSRP